MLNLASVALMQSHHWGSTWNPKTYSLFSTRASAEFDVPSCEYQELNECSSLLGGVKAIIVLRNCYEMKGD
jgi:hypothetical protein